MRPSGCVRSVYRLTQGKRNRTVSFPLNPFFPSTCWIEVRSWSPKNRIMKQG